MPLLRNIFERRSSRVLRVLLTDPNRKWVLRELAKESQISLGMASYVTSSLVRMGFAARDNSNHLILSDPSRLLRQWAASSNYVFLNQFSEYYTFDTEFESFLSRLRKLSKTLKSKYSMTLHAAAWLVAPYVRPTDFHIYVKSSMNRKEIAVFAKALSLSPIEKSGNVKLVTPYDDGVFYGSREIKQVRIVSLVQLYVDLLNYPGRGEEAAEKIWDQLNEKWSSEYVRQ